MLLSAAATLVDAGAKEAAAREKEVRMVAQSESPPSHLSSMVRTRLASSNEGSSGGTKGDRCTAPIPAERATDFVRNLTNGERFMHLLTPISFEFVPFKKRQLIGQGLLRTLLVDRINHGQQLALVQGPAAFDVPAGVKPLASSGLSPDTVETLKIIPPTHLFSIHQVPGPT